MLISHEKILRNKEIGKNIIPILFSNDKPADKNVCCLIRRYFEEIDND